MNRDVLICLPCLLLGGTEMHTLALVRVLVERSYRVTVCAYYEHDGAMAEQFRLAGADVVLLGLGRDAARRNVGLMPALARALAAVIARLRPRFVHVQYLAPGIVPILLARAMGVPRVLSTIHVPSGPFGWRRVGPRTLGTRVCDAFVCVSQVAERSFFGDTALFDADLLRRGRRHFAIPNCVDLAEVDRVSAGITAAGVRHALGLNGNPIVGAVSRLSAEKGISTLIRAMANVVRTMPQARLLIVGDGPERSALEAEARARGIFDHVIWAGRLPRTRAYEHLAIADVVVVPSRFEGFGLTAAEAMAFAKPVVASAVGGLREVVTHERSGLLVSVDDAAAMSRSITALLDDPARRSRMGLAGRRRVEDEYSFETFARRWSGLYEALA